MAESRARMRQTASFLSPHLLFLMEGCWDRERKGKYEYSCNFGFLCSHMEHNTECLWSCHSNVKKIKCKQFIYSSIYKIMDPGASN